jgi:hypothetical protein
MKKRKKRQHQIHRHKVHKPRLSLQNQNIHRYKSNSVKIY